jgi:hypothetical protein
MGDELKNGVADISELTSCNSTLYAIAVLTDLGWRYAKSMHNGFGVKKDGVFKVTRELSEALLYKVKDKKYHSDLDATEAQQWKSVKTLSIGII